MIRGGAGLYYENYIFNNTLFDRPNKLQKGLFFGLGQLDCTASGPLPAGSVTFNLTSTNEVDNVNGVDLATGVCHQPLSVAGPLVFQLQQRIPGGHSSFGSSSERVTSLVAI